MKRKKKKPKKIKSIKSKKPRSKKSAKRRKKFNLKKQRIKEGDNYRNETNNEFKKRFNKKNMECSPTDRENIRKNLKIVQDYIYNKIKNDKLVDSKSRTGTTYPRRLRNLRSSLTDCKISNFENFSDTNQREANEFLKFLLNLYPDDKKNLEENIYYTNDLETDIRNEGDISNLKGKTCKIKEHRKGDIYYFISPSDIASAPEECRISNFLRVKDEITANDDEGPWKCGKKDKKFNRRIKFNNCIETRYLIFDLLRAMKFNGGGNSSNSSSNNSSSNNSSSDNSSSDNSSSDNGIYLDNKIIPDKEITLTNGKKFKFVSSVIRTPGMGGAHFTSLILINQDWHFYDDNPAGDPILEKIGDYDELLEYNNEKVKDSVMYFYEPLE